ncbi:hypothetical protein [Agrilutibacter solisilvae]|uniref:Uncharacterized protein n=1 Tax=Agrilutibacter solisilvae TaxID=2763317 RepID=A0A974Y1K3_9GAMM|nr:hypothetical protein [Lysobacter solisilvae]QSX78720.1 hypothetical protein I8J32_001910 [Lysobacter solisilvae]
MSISTDEKKVALAQEATKIVVALIQGVPNVFGAAGAEEAGRRAAAAFSLVYDQIKNKTL